MKTFWAHERPFDGYGDYVELTEEEIEAMNYEYNGVNWRDGAVTYGVGLLGEPTFKGVIAKDRWTRINERERTYHFANGVMTSVERPTWLWPSSSGTHYIKDSYGKIHIVSKAWVRVTITE